MTQRPASYDVITTKLLAKNPVARYRSAEDLIRKTPDYYQHVARKRIDEKLGSVDRYATAHFDGTNPYQTAIAHTMVFLRHVLDDGDLGRLWDLRCVASHQANAFYFEDIPGSTSPEGQTGLVEYLFAGSLVFALDKIGNVATVDELWAAVGGYDLPDHALLERPSDMRKFPVQGALKITNLTLKGAGTWIDEAYGN
jgi:hypothetical protein